MTAPVKSSAFNPPLGTAHLTLVAGWQVVGHYGDPDNEVKSAQKAVAVVDRAPRGRVRIEGDTAADRLEATDLAHHAGWQTDDGFLYRLRPDLFLHSAPGALAPRALTRLSALAAVGSGLVTVTDVSHGLAELCLIGPASAQLLRRLCGLDFHERSFGDGHAFQSSLAKTSQLIIRRDVAGLPAYRLIGPRSFARYLWQTIGVAGVDIGLATMGELAWQTLTGGVDD